MGGYDGHYDLSRMPMGMQGGMGMRAGFAAMGAGVSGSGMIGGDVGMRGEAAGGGVEWAGGAGVSGFSAREAALAQVSNQ